VDSDEEEKGVKVKPLPLCVPTVNHKNANSRITINLSRRQLAI
jgi:hypothetical protein